MSLLQNQLDNAIRSKEFCDVHRDHIEGETFRKKTNLSNPLERNLG